MIREDFLAWMRNYFEERSDAELHLTSIVSHEEGYRVSGFISNSLIGNIVLPEGLEIRRRGSDWLWQGGQ